MMNGIDSSGTPVVAATPAVETGIAGLDPLTTAQVEMLFDSLEFVIPEIEEFLASADELDGTILVENGVLTSDLETPSGPLQGTINLPEEVNELSETLSTATGTATFENGVLVGELTIGDDLLSGSVNSVELISDVLPELVNSIEAEIPFENGQLAIATSTPFGDIEGTLSFGNGQLLTDLITPFGPVEFALDFEDDDQIAIDVNGRPGTVDLANGIVTADLFPGVLGNEVSIPLTAFSGTATLNNGIANFTIPTVFGDLSGSVDVSQQLLAASTDLLSSVNGTVSLNGGILTSDLLTSAGSLSGELDLATFFSELATSLTEVNGTLSFADGILTSDLTTPLGDIVGVYDLADLVDNDEPVEDIEPPVEVPGVGAIA